ncbi:MAG: hypothetical protein ACR2LI_12145 [Propionibacteriaceae bacterium]
MTGYLPPGWPADVRPPGATDWESTATAYLLDCCPPDFRRYPVLRRHPVVLARFASHFVAGQCDAAQIAVALIRTELAEQVSSEVVAAAADAWLEQGARLQRVRRGVRLVEEALQGVSFVPKL